MPRPGRIPVPGAAFPFDVITGREGKCGFVGFSDVILLLFEGGLALSFGEFGEAGEFCEVGEFCEFRGLGSPSIFYIH